MKKKIFDLLMKILIENKYTTFSIEFNGYTFKVDKNSALENFEENLQDIENEEIWDEDSSFLIISTKLSKRNSYGCSIESQHSTCGIIAFHNWYGDINESIVGAIKVAKILSKKAGYGAIILNHTSSSIISRAIRESRVMRKVFEVQNPRTSNIIQTFMCKL